MKIVESGHVNMLQLHPLAAEPAVAPVAKGDHQPEQEPVLAAANRLGIGADEIGGEGLPSGMDIDLRRIGQRIVHPLRIGIEKCADRRFVVTHCARR